MLNKDQYNQDEYNDYYRQEAQGAEIRPTSNKGGMKGKLILLLTLIALAVAGFFGFKMLSSSNETTSEDEINIKEQNSSVVKTETSKTTNVETEVANAVQSTMQSNDTMSAEEIAKVVALVMSQMKEQQPVTAPTTTGPTDPIKDDTDLMNALSGSNVDTVQNTQENEAFENMVSNTDTDTEIKSDNKQIDTYNKVTLQSESGKDELSRLSDQISSVMKDDSETSSSTAAASTYTKSIKKEVATRSNEMRIIVVKKGDTLGKIAQRAYGNVMDYKKIYKANPDILNRPDRIYVGQKLRIPK